jgi:basic membrane protein A and related proteins
MRGSRLVKLLAVLAVVTVLGAVVAALGVAQTVKKGAQKPIQVALLFPGTPTDGSWSNAWADGAKAAAKQYNAKLTLVPLLETPDQYVNQGAAFGAKGYDLVIMANGIALAPIQKLATQFPNTMWCMSPTDFTDRNARQTSLSAAAAQKNLPQSNTCVAEVEQQDGDFRAGVLAGMLTKTNKIASINGFAFPALTRQAEAFYLGAKCVNSKIQFEQKYINSWTDPALAKAAAEGFISNGADFILGATDSAVQGAFEAAKNAKNPTYVIPSYFDSYKQSPTVVITSVLFNLQGVGYDLVKRFATKQLPDRFFKSYNFANLGVGKLAPYYGLGKVVTPAARAQLAKIDKGIRTGTIQIPDETVGKPTIGKEGTGKSIDVKSLGCKPVK